MGPAEEPQTGRIDGLTYLPAYVDREGEAALVHKIDDQHWLTDLKRRVQHYGWRYDYTARRVEEAARLGPLPGWLAPLCDRLVADGLFQHPPDQAIVNEYLPGQGIAPHVDAPSSFGPVVASLSLGSACVMTFESLDGAERIPALLMPRSLLVLSGEARLRWRHGIPARKSDRTPDGAVARGRRLSLTFRTVQAEV